MAYPGTFDISYYKGDSLDFKIFPKDNSGAAFALNDFTSVKFTIADSRGNGATQFLANSSIVSAANPDYVLCQITPGLGAQLDADIQYVYDVEIKNNTGSIVYTLLTGTITITDQVTGAL
jgi:hypothetical protein